MTRKLFSFLGAALLALAGASGPAAADGPVTHFEVDVTFPDFVTCLDSGPLLVWINLSISGTFHGDGPGVTPPNGFEDGNGGIHIQRLLHYSGTIESDDGLFMWDGHGVGTAIWNSSSTLAPRSLIGLTKEVWFASGDYPDLLTSFEARFVVDANGNLVIAKPPSFTYKCLP